MNDGFSRYQQHFPLDTCLSLCLPAYNEERVIEKTVDAASAILPTFVREFEIVVADDGSRDRTGEVLARCASSQPRLRVVTHSVNRGYGAAVASALNASHGELVCLLDADGQFDLHELGRFLYELQGCDMAVGYRARRADNWLRTVCGRIWTVVVRLCVGLRARDVDCAFKVFRRQTADRLSLKSTGNCVSAEIMIKSIAMNLRIVEIPVTHLPRREGAAKGLTVRVLLNAVRELRYLIHFRAAVARHHGLERGRSSESRAPTP